MKVIVSYQTLQFPPPYSFAYTLDMKIDDDQVKINFQQEYLNRDTLTEEEIINEGFTNDDDFKWQGKLGKVWADYLSKVFDGVSLQDVSNDDNLYIHMAIGNGRPGMVIDTDYWDYKLHELVQAIYEAGKRENKMHLEFMLIEGKNKNPLKLAASFENRKVRIDHDQSMTWENFRVVMNLVFNVEYEEKSTKNPDTPGLWVDFEGAGDYYQIPGKSVRDELANLLY